MDKHIDLRLGRYQDVLADVECDAVIADPPYSERNHAGALSLGGSRPIFGKRKPSNRMIYPSIAYAHWDASDVRQWVEFWHPRCRGWLVAMTSHDLIPAYEASFVATGRAAFAPVPIRFNMGPRFMADGPASAAVYLCVARPRAKRFIGWGSLPGWYDAARDMRRSDGTSDAGQGRGKPAGLMRAIVSDYSRPGDLVCDPCAGYGSTLAAALTKGRRAVGAEVDAEVHAEALRRLAGVQYVDLFDPGRASQGGLGL